MNILAALLTDQQNQRKASDRAIARAASVSATTIGRIKRGESIDLDTLHKVCAWIGIDPSSVLDASWAPREKLGDQMEALLAMHPKLYEGFEQAIQLILEGKVHPATLREIAAYMSFRVQLDLNDGYSPAPEYPVASGSTGY